MSVIYSEGKVEVKKKTKSKTISTKVLKVKTVMKNITAK